jgi:hypothetical protein
LFVHCDYIVSLWCSVCLPESEHSSFLIDHHVGGAHEQSAKDWQIVAIVELKRIDDDVAD